LIGVRHKLKLSKVITKIYLTFIVTLRIMEFIIVNRYNSGYGNQPHPALVAHN